jgi:hypothetical protein
MLYVFVAHYVPHFQSYMILVLSDEGSHDVTVLIPLTVQLSLPYTY